jgi:hypothetical protein
MTHEQNIENDMLLAQNSVDMKKYNRIKPDFFLEVYKGTHTNTIYELCLRIDLFEHFLNTQKDWDNLKTIAIFKIKIKKNVSYKKMS